MPIWKEITICDKATFDQIMKNNDSLSSRCAFANLFIWKNKHKPTISFSDNNIFIKTEDNDSYYYPWGCENTKDAIDFLLSEAHKEGKKLVLFDITETNLTELQSLYKDKFEITEDRNAAEYIYTVDKLSKLPGRNLSSKRNHINRFLEKNSSWKFSKMDSSNIDNVRKFVKDYFSEDNHLNLEQEKIAINLMLDNFEKLEIIGGVLESDNKIIAITAGTILNKTTFDTHFEIAIADIQGAYAMINREFAKLIEQEYPNIQLINREEDLGLEGLRKAKLSYHPELLLMKYIAKEK